MEPLLKDPSQKTRGSIKINNMASNSRTHSAQSINRGDGMHDTTSDEEDVKRIRNSNIQFLEQDQTNP